MQVETPEYGEIVPRKIVTLPRAKSTLLCHLELVSRNLILCFRVEFSC